MKTNTTARAVVHIDDPAFASKIRSHIESGEEVDIPGWALHLHAGRIAKALDGIDTSRLDLRAASIADEDVANRIARLRFVQ